MNRSPHSRQPARRWALAVCLLAGWLGPSAWAHTVDAPRIEITSRATNAGPEGAYYRIRDLIVVRAVFDETVWVTNSPAVQVTLSATSTPLVNRNAIYRGGSGSRFLQFEYAVRAGDADPDGISVPANPFALGAGGTIVDVDGHPADLNSDEVWERQMLVDGVAPRAMDVVAVSPNGTYAAGDHIDFEVRFSEDITVNGDVDLLVTLGVTGRGLGQPGGPQSRRAELVSQPRRSGRVLLFRYTVQAGDEDGDGLDVEADALTGGTITDAVGNPAIRTLTAQHFPHLVEAVPSAVVGVEISSSPRRGDAYRVGETIEVRVTFTETVHVTGDLTLNLSIGALTRAARFITGSGTATLVFRYVVQSGDEDDDGISIGPDALRGGEIENNSGANLDDRPERRITAIPSLSGHKVNGTDVFPATVIDRRISSTPAQGTTYGTGEAIHLTITFSTIVFVEEDIDEPDPIDREALSLLLDIGENTRAAAYYGGGGTTSLTFRYVVQQGDRDDDGISVGPGGASLAGGRIVDVNGALAIRAFQGLPRQGGHRVNAVSTGPSPRVQQVEITSRPRLQRYGPGERIEVAVAFSQRVYVREAAQELELLLSIGAQTRAAQFLSGSGTTTLRFRYVTQATDYDADGVSIGPGVSVDENNDRLAGSLIGGRIEDDNGMEVPRDFLPVGPNPIHRVGSGRAEGPPAIRAVTITSSPAGGLYRPGDTIEVTVEFSESVNVEPPLRMRLSIGPNLRDADYASGSGSRLLKFHYVVQANDRDDDGISIGPGPGALVGGIIQDDDGNAAVRDFTALQRDDRHRVGPPTQVSATGIEITSTTDDVYQSGDVIEVTVTFAAPVTARGAPVVALLIGSETRQASLHAGNGTEKLVFRYTVQAGDSDENGISIGAGRATLTGGTIEDEHGFAAERNFAALRDDPKHKVAAGPNATGVAVTSSPASGDTYRPGEDITVSVTFDSVVTVADASRVKLAIKIGQQFPNANFIGGSGTRTLRFRYTVQTGDEDADGISIDGSALELSCGRITNAAGVLARCEFESLADQRGHKVSGASVVTAALASLVVGGAAAEVPLAGLLTQTGLGYRGSFAAPEVDPPQVVTATLAGTGTQTVLTVTPLVEGTANIVVTARNAAITLVFSVTVGADAAETAVLEDALASVGRGLMASASDVIGGRLQGDPTASRQVAVPDRRGYPRRPPPKAGWSADGGGATGGNSLQWLSNTQRLHPDPNYPNRGMGAEQLLSGLAFDMPLLDQREGGSTFSVWGAGDVRRFDGEADEGSFDGDLQLAYLGLDARVGGWVAGAAVAHSRGDVTYDASTANGTIEGSLETELNAVHPYARWRINDRVETWAILGFGEGEVTHTREELGYVDEPSDLTMAMGLAGARAVLSRGQRFGLSMYGDAGMIQLETEDGVAAVNNLSLDMQRVRLGIEASYHLAFGDGRHALTPFLDIAARHDGGDGAEGAGVEVAGGVRYKGPIVSFEAKARSLVWHGADGYSESGASAAIIVEPGGDDGRGLRLSLAPRWGGAADSMDVFWRHGGFAGGRGWRGGQDRGWGFAGRVSYGFGLGDGAITPFADFDFAGSVRRTRFGVGYGLSSPWGIPLRIDLSGERTEDERGADHRFLLTGEALF